MTAPALEPTAAHALPVELGAGYAAAPVDEYAEQAEDALAHALDGAFGGALRVLCEGRALEVGTTLVVPLRLVLRARTDALSGGDDGGLGGTVEVLAALERGQE